MEHNGFQVLNIIRFKTARASHLRVLSVFTATVAVAICPKAWRTFHRMHSERPLEKIGLMLSVLRSKKSLFMFG